MKEYTVHLITCNVLYLSAEHSSERCSGECVSVGTNVSLVLKKKRVLMTM